MAFQWPSDFTLDESVDERVTMDDIATGTVTSMPLAPFVVLLLAAVAARSRRWWGTVALAVLALRGGCSFSAAWARWRATIRTVPKFVLVVAGFAYVLGGLLLSASALSAPGRACDEDNSLDPLCCVEARRHGV